MAQKLYDVVVKTGEYQNAQGETKGRFENIGVMIKGDNGPYLMLKKTFNLAGVPDLKGKNSDTIIASLYEPKQDNQVQQQGGFQQQAPQQQQGGFNQQQNNQGNNPNVPDW